MEPYIIEVKINGLNELLFVYPSEQMNEHGHYRYEVFQSERKLGSIYAEVGESLSIEWYSNDLIAQNLIFDIGRQIENKDM